MGNPLQQYFRQPKIYIKLPSGGAYSKPGVLQGDIAKMPVFGMTGMDEIVLKTPDALLEGESTARVMESCCPNVKDAWELSTLDTPVILAAIRIATFGNNMPVTHKCGKCQTENDYDLDLSRIIEHYSRVIYDNQITVDGLIIRLQPLTYRQSNELSLRNFKLQQQLSHTDSIEDETERQTMINTLYKELGVIQNDIYIASVESVQTQESVVTERAYIAEWLQNCDGSIFDAIKKQNAINRDTWAMPTFPVECGECGAKTNLMVDLDQSSFFARA